MSKKTYERLVKQLVKDVSEHTHKDELIALALAQLKDDSYLAEKITFASFAAV